MDVCMYVCMYVFTYAQGGGGRTANGRTMESDGQGT